MKYEIHMAEQAWNLFWQYVRLMPGEVGCFGYATLHPDDKIVYVDHIFLVPQESDSSQVDFIETGLAYAIEQAIKDDRLDDLKFCIHSHGHHGAFWSSTDEDMIAKMGRTTDWFASVIFNKKGETAGRIDVFDHPLLGKMQVVVKDLDVFPEGRYDEDEAAMKDLDWFVSKPKAKVPATTTKKATDKVVKSVMSPKSVAQELMDDEDASAREIAELMGWVSIVENGVRYYIDPETQSIEYQETLFDTGIDQLAWGDDVVDGTAVSDELTEEELATLMRAGGWSTFA